MAKQLKIYKLIILYMLNQVDFPMTTSQISEFIVSEGYTNFFKVQQTLNELKEEGMVRTENTYNRTYYHLTEEGFDALTFLRNDIAPAIMEDIDHYLKENHLTLKDEVNIKADFFPNQNDEYNVDLKLYEQGQPLVELRLTAPSKSTAETMAHNWNQHNQEIYTLLMESLLK